MEQASVRAIAQVRTAVEECALLLGVHVQRRRCTCPRRVWRRVRSTSLDRCSIPGTQSGTGSLVFGIKTLDNSEIKQVSIAKSDTSIWCAATSGNCGQSGTLLKVPYSASEKRATGGRSLNRRPSCPALPRIDRVPGMWSGGEMVEFRDRD